MKGHLNNLFKKLLRHPLEFVGLFFMYCLCRLLPIDKSSALGGWLARKGGIITGIKKTARRNLRVAFPENSEEENNQIIVNVLDTFGRIMAEYPNLHKIDIYNDQRFEVVGVNYIDQIRDDGKPAVLFGAHLASWEVAIMAMTQRGLKVTQMYRATNNPYVDRLVNFVQRKIGYEVLTKGSSDSRRLIEIMNHGDHLFMLVDQKMNRGMSVPFFGREAMTAPAAARLAMKYNCPLLPVQVERLGGFRFRISFHPPMVLESTGDQNKDIYSTLCRMNKMIEEWVRARPDQWLWVHNRWPKE